MSDENTDSSKEAGGADDKSKAGDKPAGDAAKAGDTSKADGKTAEEKTITPADSEFRAASPRFALAGKLHSNGLSKASTSDAGLNR